MPTTTSSGGWFNSAIYNDEQCAHLSEARECVHLWLEVIIFSRQIFVAADLAEHEVIIPTITAAMTASHELMASITHPYNLSVTLDVARYTLAGTAIMCHERSLMFDALDQEIAVEASHVVHFGNLGVAALGAGVKGVSTLARSAHRAAHLQELCDKSKTLNLSKQVTGTKARRRKRRMKMSSRVGRQLAGAMLTDAQEAQFESGGGGGGGGGFNVAGAGAAAEANGQAAGEEEGEDVLRPMTFDDDGEPSGEEEKGDDSTVEEEPEEIDRGDDDEEDEGDEEDEEKDEETQSDSIADQMEALLQATRNLGDGDGEGDGRAGGQFDEDVTTREEGGEATPETGAAATEDGDNVQQAGKVAFPDPAYHKVVSVTVGGVTTNATSLKHLEVRSRRHRPPSQPPTLTLAWHLTPSSAAGGVLCQLHPKAEAARGGRRGRGARTAVVDLQLRENEGLQHQRRELGVGTSRRRRRRRHLDDTVRDTALIPGWRQDRRHVGADYHAGA